MPGVARRCIRIDRSGAGKVNAEHLFAVAVCLAFHIDDRDDWAARTARLVLRDDLAYSARELPALFEADNVIGRAGKTVVGIGDDRNEARGFAAKRRIAAPHGRFAGRFAGECMEPARAAAEGGVAHACSLRALFCACGLYTSRIVSGVTPAGSIRGRGLRKVSTCSLGCAAGTP